MNTVSMLVQIARWSPAHRVVEVVQVDGDPTEVRLPKHLKLQPGARFGSRKFRRLFKKTGLRLGDLYRITIDGEGRFSLEEKVS